jgi:L-fuconolactonase
MPDFPIVDSHVHLYDPSWLRYGWLETVPKINRAVGMADFDAARGPVTVERLVFVEVNVDRGLHCAEAAYVQDLADRDPRIAGIVAHAPVEKGAGVEADLERLGRNRCLRGVRRLIQGEADPGICLEPGFVEGVQRVGRHGLVFDICVKHWQLPFVGELVRRCPDTAFVLDHIGKPGIRHGFVEPWRGEIARLAQSPNVACKLSGVVTEADHESWSKDQLRPYLDHALACFGPDRLLFGSDWPVAELTHAYPAWVRIVDELLAAAGDAAARKVFRDNALRIYRLE